MFLKEFIGLRKEVQGFFWLVASQGPNTVHISSSLSVQQPVTGFDMYSAQDEQSRGSKIVRWGKEKSVLVFSQTFIVFKHNTSPTAAHTFVHEALVCRTLCPQGLLCIDVHRSLLDILLLLIHSPKTCFLHTLHLYTHTLRIAAHNHKAHWLSNTTFE